MKKTLLLAFIIFSLIACSSDSKNENKPIWFQDKDGDGFGNAAVTQKGAKQPTSYVKNNTDCDDSDPFIHPDMPEIANNDIDEKCDNVDLGLPPR